MSNSPSSRRFEPSAEVLALAKTRLPLRLPPPDQAGPGRVVGSSLRERGADSPLGSRDLHQQHLRRSHSPHLLRPRSKSRGFTLVVNPPAERRLAYQPTDAELEARAQQALYRAGILSFARLRVEVQQRRATVYGTLIHDFELLLALQTVRRVNGIQQVSHEVSLTSPDESGSSSPVSGSEQSESIFRSLASMVMLAFSTLPSCLGCPWRAS